MEPILKKRFRESILQLTDNNFQEFCQELFLQYYKNDFQVIKNKRDKGSDGIIENKIIVAMYSPEKLDLRKFKSKVSEDFKLYEKYWKNNYPDWLFVYNGEMTSDRKIHLDKYIVISSPMDIDNILFYLTKLKYKQIFELGAFLKIDKDLLSYSVLKNVVDDLTQEENFENLPLEKPLYIEDKIKLNFSKQDCENMSKEYEELLPEINRLRIILRDYDEKENTALKIKVKRIFDNLKGNFKDKIGNATEILSQEHEKDEIYQLYVRVIIIYLFEYCFLGKKTKEELKC